MKKIDVWFKNLSRVGKISTLSTLVLGSMFVAGAASQTSQQQMTNPENAVQQKKEPIVTTKQETETQAIPFEKQTIESSSLAKGTTQIQTAGVNGIKTITYTVSITDGVETGRVSTGTVTTLGPVNEVTVIGTYVKPIPSCDSNYSGCVPIVSYDLDCSDVGYSVTVLGYDTHGFDRDGDGYGCESY